MGFFFDLLFFFFSLKLRTPNLTPLFFFFLIVQFFFFLILPKLFKVRRRRRVAQGNIKEEGYGEGFFSLSLFFLFTPFSRRYEMKRDF